MKYSFIETANGISYGISSNVHGNKDLYLFYNDFDVVNTPVSVVGGDSLHIKLIGNDIDISNTFGIHANAWKISGNYTGDNHFEGQNDFPFVFSNMQIMEDARLIFPKGTIIKFQSNSGMTVKGSLKAIGDMTNPVIVTALADDRFGGDTNGDGDVTNAEPGSL